MPGVLIREPIFSILNQPSTAAVNLRAEVKEDPG